MLATYVSAALICAASLLVGRALLALAGQRRWSWLEPAVGFAALLCATGLPARGPGHATTSALALVALIVAAAVVLVLLRDRPEPEDRFEGERDVLLWGLLVAFATAVVLSIPFAVSGRWGLLGVGFNNDLGLHLAWAEWLRSGFGPAPEAGYPLGPHALADAVAAVPGIGLGQAFVGEIFAIGILTSLTALAALPGLGPARRVLGAVLVAASYLAASYYAQGAFKETAEALFVLAVALALRDPAPLPAGAVARLRYALPYLALAGGVLFAYSFAGLAWPIAVVALWSLTVPPVRRALAPRSLIRFLLRPTTLIVIALVAGIAVADHRGRPVRVRHRLQPSRRQQHLRPGLPGRGARGLVGPQLPPRRAGRVDPAVAGGGDRRRRAGGGDDLVGAPARPLGPARVHRLRPPLLRLAALHRRLLAGEGADDRRAAGDADRGPAAAERDHRPAQSRIVRAGWAVARRRLHRRRRLLELHSSCATARSARPGHGSELQSFLPILHGKPVLYAGQDRYAAYDLLGADTHVPLVEFPDPAISPNPEKPFDTGDAYSPIDFDSFTKRDPQPLPLRDHRPRRLEQPGAAELPADRHDPLLHPLGTGRQGARRNGGC